MREGTEKERAKTLRLKGFSYHEIRDALGVPKSTLASWFSRMPLPVEATKRLQSRIAAGTLRGLVRRNKLQTVWARERAQQTQDKASREIHQLTTRDVCLVGAVLYWAEGYKRAKMRNGQEITNHTISLTNSDPAIVAAFVRFLRDVLGVANNKIRVDMRLFKHIEPENAILYWMRVTKLSRSQFGKPSYPVSLSSKGKRPFNRLPYGTVQVIVADTPLFYRVMGFIDGIKKRLNLERL